MFIFLNEDYPQTVQQQLILSIVANQQEIQKTQKQI
jgi:hypothetical protein